MSDARQPEEAGIGLRQYLDVVRRRKWIVIVIVALAVGASAMLTLSEQSIYQAEATIAVGQGRGLFSPQNGNSIQPFSATMKELLESNVVARGVIGDLKLPLTPSQLLGKVSVSFNPDSAALHVSVLDHVPATAKAIAASMSTHFTDLFAKRFGTTATGGSDPVRAFVWDPAHVVPGRVSPTPTRNLIIAAVLGLVLGLLAAFLRDHFDRSLRTTDEIEKAFGVPVIAQIPTIRRNAKERPRMLWDENGEFAESFRGLRANLEYLAVQRPLKTILVTSPAANQGKTTVCANLATALAQSGASVVLLEADLRRPALSAAFGLRSGQPGLTSVLVGNVQLGRATVAIELPEHPGQGGNERSVTVLPSGPLPPNPSELVASPRMRRLVEGLGDLFDTVVIDSPPILPVADTLGLAKLVDGVIVVVRAKSATRDEALEVRAMVDRLDIPLVGIVVSDVAVRGGYGTYGSYTSVVHDNPTPDPAADIEASIERLRAKKRTASVPAPRARASSDR
jgi:receptor protein-tyrosine kinase/non-specific protein-tyrosine kinase